MVKIKFKSSVHAEQCTEKMDGGLFDDRILKCFLWDGKVDFRHAREDKSVLDQRIKDFGTWLEKGEEV